MKIIKGSKQLYKIYSIVLIRNLMGNLLFFNLFIDFSKLSVIK